VYHFIHVFYLYGESINLFHNRKGRDLQDRGIEDQDNKQRKKRKKERKKERKKVRKKAIDRKEKVWKN
jgi:hypothetical protein